MDVLLRLLLVLLASASSSSADAVRRHVRSQCGEDTLLPCGAALKAGVRYRDVRWYKVTEGPQPERSGILRKSLLTNVTHQYSDYGGTAAPLLDGDSLDLLLPNTTAQNGGTYSCFLGAPVGERNQEGLVHLTVIGCPEETTFGDLWFEGILFFIVALSLFLFFICWVLLKNLSVLEEKQKQLLKEKILKSPLQKKTLQLIYTPGGKDGSPFHHVCV